MYDVIIIGAGPAGLTSAIYTSRALLGTLVIEKGAPGGQILSSPTIENYPGLIGVDGFTLMNNFKQQAEEFGAVINTAEICGLSEEDGIKTLKTKDGTEIKTKSVIIATGARPQKLNVKGEDKFTGRGISYCATCDGAFFRDKEVAVIGGGNSAFEEALFLTRFVKKIYLIHRRQGFRAAKILVERARKNDKIEFLLDTIVEEFYGEDKFKGLKLNNLKENRILNLEVSGAFLYVGYIPNSDSFKGVVDLNEKGYIITDENLETSVAGIYAAGDIRDKRLRQVSTAVGDGATAAFSAEKYLD
ncbi:MAG: thioredoxin-disulfide reductase [Candidatus Muiribacteriota bacterium]